MSKERRCGLCRKAPAITGRHVCAACVLNVPVRKPIEDTLAAIDATLEKGTGL